MKKVDVEFRNIQSHVHTNFSLCPGINCILANDNNVGKSTIFKTLVIVCRMPNVNNEDLLELLRVGENQGYASFTFEGEQIIFWMFREKDRVRAFFEVRADGLVNRTNMCPDSLLDALDLIRGSDNYPINFNDADSVQLVVQDTSMNDEVFAKVLIDMQVENVKANMYKLDNRVVQDSKVVVARLEDAKSLLDGLTYNEVADVFREERDFLESSVRVADLFDGVDLEILGDNLEEKTSDLELLHSLFDVVKFDTSILNSHGFVEDFSLLKNIFSLVSVDMRALSECVVSLKDVEVANSAMNVLFTLSGLEDSLSILSILVQSMGSVQDLGQIFNVYQVLDRAYTPAVNSVADGNNIKTTFTELAKVSHELEIKGKKIQCPIKGEVYYSEQKCIPTGN